MEPGAGSRDGQVIDENQITKNNQPIYHWTSYIIHIIRRAGGQFLCNMRLVLLTGRADYRVATRKRALSTATRWQVDGRV